MILSYFPRSLAIWAVLLLPACSGLPERAGLAATITQQAGFTKQIIDSGPFTLTTYYKYGPDPNSLLVVYIEGDGHAYQGKWLLQTPLKTISLCYLI